MFETKKPKGSHKLLNGALKAGVGLALAFGAFSSHAAAVREANGALYSYYGTGGYPMNGCAEAGNVNSPTGDSTYYYGQITTTVWAPAMVENGGNRLFVAVDAASTTAFGEYGFQGSDLYDRYVPLEVPLRKVTRVTMAEDVYSVLVDSDGKAWRILQNDTFDNTGKITEANMPVQIDVIKNPEMGNAVDMWTIVPGRKAKFTSAENRALMYLSDTGALYRTSGSLANLGALTSTVVDRGVSDAFVPAGAGHIFYMKGGVVHAYDVVRGTSKAEPTLTMDMVRNAHMFSNQGEFIVRAGGVYKIWSESTGAFEIPGDSFIGTHGGEAFYFKDGRIKNFCAGLEREDTVQDGSEKAGWKGVVQIGSSYNSYTKSASTAKYYRMLMFATAPAGLGNQVVKSDGGSLFTMSGNYSGLATNYWTVPYAGVGGTGGAGGGSSCDDTTYCGFNSMMWDLLNFYTMTYSGYTKVSGVSGTTGANGVDVHFPKTGVFRSGNGTLRLIGRKSSTSPVLEGRVQEGVEGVENGTWEGVGLEMYKQGTRMLLSNRDFTYTRLDQTGAVNVKTRDFDLKQGSVAGKFYLDPQTMTVLGLDGKGQVFISGLVNKSDASTNMAATGWHRIVMNEMPMPFKDLTPRNLDVSTGKYTNKIVVSWKPMPGAARYNVFRKAQGESAFSKIVSGLAVTTFTDTSPQALATANGTPIEYYVEGLYENTVLPQNTGFQVAESEKRRAYVKIAPTQSDYRAVYMDSADNVFEYPLTSPTGEPLEYNFSKDPAHGVAEIAGNNVLYTPNAGFTGVDSFILDSIDASGRVIGTEVTVRAYCTDPELTGFSVSNGAIAFKFNPEMANYSATSLSCQTNMIARMEIFDSNGNKLQYNVQEQPASAVNASGKFFLRDLDAGDYTARVTMTGDSVLTPVSLEAPFSVSPMALPKMNLSNKYFNEDEELFAEVTQFDQSCDVFTKEVDAINNKGCLVEFTTLPGGMKQQLTPKPTAKGYLGQGSDQVVESTVFFFDSRSQKREVGKLRDMVSVIAGTPIILMEPVFEKNVREVSEHLSLPLTLEPTGYSCEVFTSEQNAELFAQENPNTRVCLIKFDHLPSGMRPGSASATIEGRILNKDDNQVQYTAYKYYAGGYMSPSVTNDFAIPVAAKPVVAKVITSRDVYAAGLQDIEAELAVDYGSLSPSAAPCRFSADRDEAKSSWKPDNDQITCWANFDGPQHGLVIDERSRASKLFGRIQEAGDYEVAYTIKAVDDLNNEYIVRQGSHTLKLRDASAPVVKFTPGLRTKVLKDAEGNDMYLLSSDGNIGMAEVVNADLSTVKMQIFQDAGNGATPLTSPATRMRAGDTMPIRVRQMLGAWTQETILVKASYEELPEDKASLTMPVKVVYPPPTNMVVDFFEMQEKYVSTDNFSIQAKVGEYASGGSVNYDKRYSGVWKVWLAAQDGEGFLPMTDPMITDNEGRVLFTELEPRRFADQTVYVMAEPTEFADTGITIKSRPQMLTFVNGAPILGRLTTRAQNGTTPVSNAFAVEIDRNDYVNLGSVTWQLSRDDGTNWETLGTSERNRFNYVFTKGGRFKMKALLVNKHSGAKSETDTIDLKFKEGMTPTISGYSKVLPGSEVTLTASALDSTGQPTNDYEAVWEINDFESPVQIVTGVKSIVVGSDDTGAVNVRLKVRPSYTPDEADSYSVTARDVSFAYPTRLRASIRAPRYTESGTEVELKSYVRSSDIGKGEETNMEIVKIWTLPDGTQIEGEDIKWTTPEFELTQEETDAGVSARNYGLKFETWIKGVKDSTYYSVPVELVVQKYVFPTLALRERMRYESAPASGTLQVIPATRGDQKNLRGKKLTFTWEASEGVKEFARGSVNRIYMDAPGTYSFRVRVSDDRGNSQLMETSIVVTDPPPKTIELKAYKTQRYDRAPVTYRLRPQIYGGHPRDYPTAWKVFVNEELVGESDNRRMPDYITLNEPGQYRVRVEMTPTFNPETPVVGFLDLTATENQPPACEPLEGSFSGDRNILYVKAVCSDPDGRIMQYRFYADGVEVPTRTNRVTIDMKNRQGVSIEVVVVDDLGVETRQTDYFAK